LQKVACNDVYTTVTAFCWSYFFLGRMCVWCWREWNAKIELFD